MTFAISTTTTQVGRVTIMRSLASALALTPFTKSAATVLLASKTQNIAAIQRAATSTLERALSPNVLELQGSSTTISILGKRTKFAAPSSK